MPSTPQFGITYPCMSSTVDPAAFAELATTTETALEDVGFSVSAPGTGEAYEVTHLPTGRGLGAATPLFGVETTLTYTFAPASVVTGTGVTINTGTGAFNFLYSGFYMASIAFGGNTSTLTMTSQRIAVYVNATLYTAVKTRGTNPSSQFANGTSVDFGINILNTDTVTFRYLWTGTGVLTGPASATIALSLLART